MWQFLLVIGSAGTHPQPSVSYAIPLWVYLSVLQAAMIVLALVGIWWLGRVETELRDAARDLRRLADEVRSGGAK